MYQFTSQKITQNSEMTNPETSPISMQPDTNQQLTSFPTPVMTRNTPSIKRLFITLFVTLFFIILNIVAATGDSTYGRLFLKIPYTIKFSNSFSFVILLIFTITITPIVSLFSIYMPGEVITSFFAKKTFLTFYRDTRSHTISVLSTCLVFFSISTIIYAISKNITYSYFENYKLVTETISEGDYLMIGIAMGLSIYYLMISIPLGGALGILLGELTIWKYRKDPTELEPKPMGGIFIFFVIAVITTSFILLSISSVIALDKKGYPVYRPFCSISPSVSPIKCREWKEKKNTNSELPTEKNSDNDQIKNSSSTEITNSNSYQNFTVIDTNFIEIKSLEINNNSFNFIGRYFDGKKNTLYSVNNGIASLINGSSSVITTSDGTRVFIKESQTKEGISFKYVSIDDQVIGEGLLFSEISQSTIVTKNKHILFIAYLNKEEVLVFDGKVFTIGYSSFSNEATIIEDKPVYFFSEKEKTKDKSGLTLYRKQIKWGEEILYEETNASVTLDFEYLYTDKAYTTNNNDFFSKVHETGRIYESNNKPLFVLKNENGYSLYSGKDKIVTSKERLSVFVSKKGYAFRSDSLPGINYNGKVFGLNKGDIVTFQITPQGKLVFAVRTGKTSQIYIDDMQAFAVEGEVNKFSISDEGKIAVTVRKKDDQNRNSGNSLYIDGEIIKDEILNQTIITDYPPIFIKEKLLYRIKTGGLEPKPEDTYSYMYGSTMLPPNVSIKFGFYLGNMLPSEPMVLVGKEENSADYNNGSRLEPIKIIIFDNPSWLKEVQENFKALVL